VCCFGRLNRPLDMHSRFLGLIAASCLLLTPATLAAQVMPLRVGLRQAESEMWTRLEQRARRLGALMLDSSEIDLRIPIEGEPEEVIGVTRLTNEALAVVTARLEPLEAVASRGDRFQSGRYDLRIEDRNGNCQLVHQTVAVDTALVRLKRTTEACRPLYMAEVAHRARRLVRIPLSAGQLTDNWSVAPATMAFADVYMDSVVILTTKLMLQANPLEGDTTFVRVDSITVGLALGEGSWSVVRKSPAAVVDSMLRRGDTRALKRQRFVIPVDSTFALTRSWPVVEVSLSVPKTDANPAGLAWTYAHGPKDFFKAIRLPVKR
jgi:hypothetical protein